jgi:hypothetical protein
MNLDENDIAAIQDIFEDLKAGVFPLDDHFDRFYPALSTELSAQHFSSFYTCKQVLDFFGSDESLNVLDIGSGIGKFCFLGALLTKSNFTGIELRESLHKWAEHVRSVAQMNQIQFLNGDVKDLNFQAYNCFYLFNPFMEYKDGKRKIDATISTERGAYTDLLSSLFNKLEALPSGIKLATYHVGMDLIPTTYQLVDRKLGNTLCLYVKD